MPTCTSSAALLPISPRTRRHPTKAALSFLVVVATTIGARTIASADRRSADDDGGASHSARFDRDTDRDDGRDRDRDPAQLGDLELADATPLLALRGAPAVAEVLEHAYETAGLDRDPTRSWIRRARIAGVIPWLTVRTGWDASWRDEEPGQVGRSRTFEVRATWRLDRLLFDGREIQVSTIDASRRRERRRLASYVIRAYFTWKKVTTLAARTPSTRYTLAAEAATAELDALTDGWFSESFGQRGAPSPAATPPPPP